MASIRKQIVVHASAETVWSALRDIGALHTRLVPGFVTDTQLESGARVVTFGNGQVVRELIVDVNEAEHRVVWAIVDEPFHHYNASAQVFEEQPGMCRFIWIADVLPNELRDHVASMMDQGLATLKATMEGSKATVYIRLQLRSLSTAHTQQCAAMDRCPENPCQNPPSENPREPLKWMGVRRTSENR